MRNICMAAIGALLAVSSQPALAKNDKHGHGPERRQEWEYREDRDEDRGHGDHGHEDHDHGDRGHERVSFRDEDRARARRYMERDYHRHCPPGLARKGNGCMPPGHARRWRVGYELPQTVVYRPVPRDLQVELQPVPSGYRYVTVDQDVLLISEASHEVIDAITLLSAVR